MSLVVTDASALLEYLLGSDPARRIRLVLREPDNDLHVPALCDIEVAAGLRRGIIRRVVDDGRVEAALDDYRDLPITRHGHQRLLGRILDLRRTFTVYDACYVALAEDVGGELLTADAALARVVRRHTNVSVLP